MMFVIFARFSALSRDKNHRAQRPDPTGKWAERCFFQCFCIEIKQVPFFKTGREKGKKKAKHIIVHYGFLPFFPITTLFFFEKEPKTFLLYDLPICPLVRANVTVFLSHGYTSKQLNCNAIRLGRVRITRR